MKTVARFLAVALPATLLVACSDDDGPAAPAPAPAATIVTATGDITAKVEEYRQLLGEPANGATPGQQPSGRREIAWDGAGANPFNNRDDFPADFFANVGAVFTTDGTGFRNDSLLFAEVNPTYSSEFNFFSRNRIFSAVGSNRLDVLFQVAGAPTPALVTGFGVVFTDVDRQGSARIELFEQDGTSRGVFEAPARSDAAGLSFVGAKFDEPIVARVRITAGEGAIGSVVNDLTSGGTLDLVVMDNFIFAEPQAAF